MIVMLDEQYADDSIIHPLPLLFFCFIRIIYGQLWILLKNVSQNVRHGDVFLLW